MCNNFRLLTKDDIECRVAQTGVGKNGPWASILLYKDARVDQRIMDDTFGPMNWTAEYELIEGKLYCKVGVWDETKKSWVYKMNVGTESNTEKEKSQASDALKRACFTWGLGVELYSAPKIFVALKDSECLVDGNNVKVYPSFKLKVETIEYDGNRKISNLVLVDSRGEWRYKMPITSQNGPETGKNPVQAAKPRVWMAANGQKLTRGDSTWVYALKCVKSGKTCADGTPIPVWLAENYHISDTEMRDLFYEDLKKCK